MPVAEGDSAKLTWAPIPRSDCPKRVTRPERCTQPCVQELTQRYVRSYEVRELEQQKKVTLAALSGDGPRPGDINSRAAEAAVYQACLSQALQRGLRGEAYYQFKNSECNERVLHAHKEPLHQRLALIESLLGDSQGATAVDQVDQRTSR